MVSARPPHRPDPATDPLLRYRMVEATVDGFPGLNASRLEIDRPGRSFMVDTLAGIAAEEPDADLTLIIGADQLLAFHTWREPGRITDLARLAVVARGAADLDTLAEVAEAIAPGRIDLVAMPAIEISSTMVRERVRTGAPYDHLVPRAVADVIAHEDLYRSP